MRRRRHGRLSLAVSHPGPWAAIDRPRAAADAGDRGHAARGAHARRGSTSPRSRRTRRSARKYLRALENEEWDLLPGPDLRQELPAHLRATRWGSTGGCWSRSTSCATSVCEGDLQPIAAAPGGERARGSRPRSASSARAAARCSSAGCWSLLLGRRCSCSARSADDEQGTDGRHDDAGDAAASPPRPASRRCAIEPTRRASTRACARPTGGIARRRRAAAGAPSRASCRSRRLRLTLGNGSARLRVNGERRSTAGRRASSRRLRDRRRVAASGALRRRAAEPRVTRADERARGRSSSPAPRSSPGRVTDRNGPWLAERLLRARHRHRARS